MPDNINHRLAGNGTGVKVIRSCVAVPVCRNNVNCSVRGPKYFVYAVWKARSLHNRVRN